MSDTQKPSGGIWLPDPNFLGIETPERAFLDIVTKASSSTLAEIQRLAKAMGLTVSLSVKKSAPAARDASATRKEDR